MGGKLGEGENKIDIILCQSEKREPTLFNRLKEASTEYNCIFNSCHQEYP